MTRANCRSFLPLTTLLPAGVADQRLSVVVTSLLSLWASARMPVSESASRRPSAFGSCSATTSPSLSSRWRME